MQGSPPGSNYVPKLHKAGDIVIRCFLFKDLFWNLECTEATKYSVTLAIILTFSGTFFETTEMETEQDLI